MAIEGTAPGLEAAAMVEKPIAIRKPKKVETWNLQKKIVKPGSHSMIYRENVHTELSVRRETSPRHLSIAWSLSVKSD